LAYSNSGNLDEAERLLVTLTLPLLALGAVTLPMLYLLTRPGLTVFFPDVLVYLLFAGCCLWVTINGAETARNVMPFVGNVGLPIAFGFLAARFAPMLVPHAVAILLLNACAWLPAVLLGEMVTPQLRRLQGKPPLVNAKGRARHSGNSRASIGCIIILGTLAFAGAAFSDTPAHLDTFVIGFFAIPFYLCVFSLLALGNMLQRVNANPAAPLPITGNLFRPWFTTALIVLLIGLVLATSVAAVNPWGLFGLDKGDFPTFNSPFASRQGENSWTESGKPDTAPPVPTAAKIRGQQGKPAGKDPGGKPGGTKPGPAGKADVKSPAPAKPSTEHAPPEKGQPGNATPTAPNPGQGSAQGGGLPAQLRDQAADKLLNAALSAAHAGEPPTPKPSTPPPPETPKEKLDRLKHDLRENGWRIVKLVFISLLLLVVCVLLIGWLRRWWKRRQAAQRTAQAAAPARSPFDDPFTSMPEAAQAEIIRAVYETFFAYAWLAGYTRKPQQTEFAFADWLANNTPLNSTAVWVIIRRCTRAYYANSDLTAKEMEDLHAALSTFIEQTTARLTPAELAQRQSRYVVEQVG